MGDLMPWRPASEVVRVDGGGVAVQLRSGSGKAAHGLAVTGGVGRVAGLDGLRGFAALYVLLFHCWLFTFHGFPVNRGPVWLGWLLYGRLAVVFFLTLSGFSLALAPAANSWRLGGVARYARRRAWRILPPYWAALAFSLVIAWAVTPQPHSGPPTVRSIAVYGLLLQDVLTAPIPNGTFWSIAVEAELYAFLPVLLVLRRRAGALLAFAAVSVPVVVLGLIAPGPSPVDKVNGVTPQLAPLFAVGVLGAGIVAVSTRIRHLPWHWLAALAAAPLVALILYNGSVWTVRHYFWFDLAIGPVFAMFLAGVATGRPVPLLWLLMTKPIRRLGSFSYSLYLVHLPIVIVVIRRVVEPHGLSGQPAFWLTVALAVPGSLLAAWLFASVFEIPFQRYRSWTALRAGWRPVGWVVRVIRVFGRRHRRPVAAPAALDRDGEPGVPLAPDHAGDDDAQTGRP
jgi:peptidoglycan/LPS O-acetylase OafA/YrhL